MTRRTAIATAVALAMVLLLSAGCTGGDPVAGMAEQLARARGAEAAAEFLEPLALSQYRLAHDISVPPRRINEIVNGQRAITANTALRLGRYFGMAPEFWLNLQTHYDLEQEHERLAGRLQREVKARAAA